MSDPALECLDLGSSGGDTNWLMFDWYEGSAMSGWQIGVEGWGEKGLFRLLRAIGEYGMVWYLYPPPAMGTPLECLERHSLPWAELWRDRLKGIGVP